MKKLRVLHIITRFLPGGGAERNLLHFISWQQKAGHEVKVIVGGDSDLAYLTSVPGLVLPHLVRSIRPPSDARALIELRRIILEGEYDVVHTHQSKAGVLGRLAARGRTPVIVHSVHMTAFGRPHPWVASAGFRWAERICAEFTDFIVTVGNELRDTYISAGVGRPQSYRVIPTPIDIERFGAMRDLPVYKVRAAKSRFVAETGDVRVITMIGSLEARKRQALAIRCLAPLLRVGALRLLIAGEGPEREALQHLIDTEGLTRQVQLLGLIGQIEELLLVSDLLVHVSAAEGVPQVVVQALACGVPVVATEVCGLREVGGEAVLSVGAGGEGLAEAVVRTLDRPPPPPPLEAFDRWRAANVEARIADLHNDFQERLCTA